MNHLIRRATPLALIGLLLSATATFAADCAVQEGIEYANPDDQHLS